MLKKIQTQYSSLPIQVRASVWFFACSFLQKGISSVTTPIFTRLLSVAEYGQFSVFNSWLGIAGIFVSLNLYCGVYAQGLVKFEAERKRYTSSLQGLTLLLVCIWTGIYMIFRQFWNKMFGLTTVQMLAMLVLIWISAVFGFWSMEQRIDYKYRSLIFITVFVSIATPIVGIIFVMHADDKVTARILATVLVYVIAYVGLFVIQMWQGKTFYNQKIWKYALRFNIPLIPHYLSMTVLNSADRIMIDKMVNQSAAGIYSLAYSISLIMTMFNTALAQTIEPWLYKKIKQKAFCDIPKVGYTCFLLIAGLNIMLIAFAPEIVLLFAPKEYYDAIWVIPPVAMSVVFMFLYSFFAVFEFYYEKTKYIALATTVGAVVNIGLNAVFIRIFGYYAAGYTTLLCYILFAIFHYLFMRKICKEYLNHVAIYNTKTIFVICLGFMGCGFAFLFLYSYPVLRYALIAGLGVFLLIKRKTVMMSVRNLVSTKQNTDT